MHSVIGWDVETPPFAQGNPTPKLVVATYNGGSDTLHLAAQVDVSDTAGVWLEVAPDGSWKLALLHDRALDFHLLLIEALLSGDLGRLVAHNQGYDWSILVNEWPDLLPLFTLLLEEGLCGDTLIREALIAIALDNFAYDSRTGRKNPFFSLAYLVKAYFGIDISADKKGPDAWRLRYGELYGVALDTWPEAALSYAVQDAVYARDIYLEQTPPVHTTAGEVVRADGFVVNEIEQTRADWALRCMAVHGVYTDGPAVEEFAKRVKAEADEANKAAKQGGFWVINKCKECDGTGVKAPVLEHPITWHTCPVCEGLDHDIAVALGKYKSRAKAPDPGRRMSRLHARVSAAYGGYPERTDPSKKYPEGQVKADSDTLEGSDDEFLVRYAEGSGAIKLWNTYEPILTSGVRYPINSDPNVLVRTGRTSWGKPNLQNPPRTGGFRECFVPRKGKVFASIDYSGLEMTTLGELCIQLFGFSSIADAINEGKDLHTLFAAKMLEKEGWDRTYEEWNKIRKDKSHVDYDLIKARRQQAKAANFGFPGGLGAKAFIKYAWQSYRVKLTPMQAEDLKKQWFDMWPEMEPYFERISNLAGGYGGRFALKQLFSERVRGGCSFTSGANTGFQGLAADGAKAAMWVLYKACYLGELPDYLEGEECHLYGVRMWAFIHDEFLFEGDDGTAHLWAPQASKIMVEEMKKWTPHVHQAAPPALMYRWYKDADPVYVEGKLVPWEPKEKE